MADRRSVICIPSYRTSDSNLFDEVVPYLLKRGWYRPPGIGKGSHVGKNRNILANHFLDDPQCQQFEWSWWCDDDMLLKPQAALELIIEARREGRSVLNMIAVPGQSNSQTFACDLAEASLDEQGRRCVYLGPERGRHYRCRRIGMGITAIHRSVFEKLRDVADHGIIADPKEGPPILGHEFFPSGMRVAKRCDNCKRANHSGGGPDCSFGLAAAGGYCHRWEPATERDAPRSHGEDYGFSVLCELAGVQLHTTTRLRCYHLHPYPFSWEDAFRQPTRAAGDELKVFI